MRFQKKTADYQHNSTSSKTYSSKIKKKLLIAGGAFIMLFAQSIVAKTYDTSACGTYYRGFTYWDCYATTKHQWGTESGQIGNPWQIETDEELEE